MMKTGTKVVCIDDSISANKLLSIVEVYPNWIKKHSIYTVETTYYVHSKLTGIILVEVKNPKRKDILRGFVMEPGFDIRRFREINDPLNETIEEIEKGFTEKEFGETFFNPKISK